MKTASILASWIAFLLALCACGRGSETVKGPWGRDRVLDARAYEHAIQGGVLFGEGKFREAATELDEALDLEPDSPELKILLAEALFRAGDTDRAAGTILEVLAEAPEIPDAWIVYGELLDKEGRSHQAAASYGRAVSLSQEIPDPRPFNALSEMRMKEGDLDGAAQVSVEISRLGGFSPQASRVLARYALASPWPSAAIERFHEEGIPYDRPLFTQGAVAMGCGLLDQGKSEAARSFLEAAALADPRNPNVKDALRCFGKATKEDIETLLGCNRPE